MNFNPKVFKTALIWVPVAGAINIRRRYVWSKLLNKYVDPPRGGKYEARRSGGPKQERKSKMFCNLNDARAWQQGHNIIQSAENSLDLTSSVVPTKSYSVGYLLNDWQKRAWPNMAEGTRIAYRRLVQSFAFLRSLQVEDLTPRHIDDWLDDLKLKPYRKTRLTLEKEFDALRAMINWYINTTDHTKLVSPFKKRHSAMLKIKERKVFVSSHMNESELETWLAELRQKDFLFYALALTQTKQLLRVSEVCAMKWKNLNLRDRTYSLSEHVVWPRVGGAKAQVLPGTKTLKDGKPLVIHLRKEVTDLLQRMSLQKIGDFIFSLNGLPLEYRQVQHAYDSAFKTVGLPFRGTHICRHTGATSFLEETGDFLALQQMGGWKDLNMAMHYGKILNTRAKNAIEKVEQRKLQLVKSDNDCDSELGTVGDNFNNASSGT